MDAYISDRKQSKLYVAKSILEPIIFVNVSKSLGNSKLNVVITPTI